jgi:hypothetical protein
MRIRRIVISATMAVAVLAPGTAAWADDGAASADDVATLIDTVAPDQGTVQQPTGASDGSPQFATDSSVIDAPASADQPIDVSSSASGDSLLQVSLPPEAGSGQPEVAQDGTVVYTGGDSAADAAVQVLDDGALRLQTVTNESDGPDRFSYTFGDGVHPLPADDGTISLVVGDGPTATIATVDPAWAQDANGDPVATRYQIDGDSLVQVIAPSADTAYPVVADPKITFGWGVYLNGYGVEWKILTASVSAVGGAAVVGACIAVNVPNPWGAVLKAACGTVGASNLKNYLNWIRSAYNANPSLDNGTCYQTNLIFKTRLTPVRSKGNCY